MCAEAPVLKNHSLALGGVATLADCSVVYKAL
jgi:hypothetical protein